MKTKLITFGLFIILHWSVNSFAKEKSEKLNLLFIMTDQQRFDALGKAGQFAFLKTPNLDRLASEGAWFTNAYSPCAVCAPSRTSILTGLAVENHGVKTNDLAYDNTKVSVKTFDQVLAEKGYYSEYWGKFHSPIHLTEGYQQFKYSVNSQGRYTLQDQTDYKNLLKDSVPDVAPGIGQLTDPTFFKKNYTLTPIDMRYQKGEDFRRTRVDNGNTMDLTQPDCHGQLEIPSKFSLTNYQTECAVKAIQRAASQEKPFNITVSYFFPHAPMLPTYPWSKLYRLEDMPVPASIHDPMSNSPYGASNGRIHMPEYRDENKIRYMMQSYFALVSEIDSCVGVLMHQLEINGFSENTLVIFTSDHGEMLGSHGMREKNVFYEESSHIPLIVWAPKNIRPTRVDGYISLVDLYPTIMDYLSVNGGSRDGKSLRALIEGSEQAHGKYVVTEWDYRGPGEPNYMVVSDGWKLITSYGTEQSNTHALYNLNADPYEMNNLIGSNPDAARQKEKVDELRGYLVEWLQKIGSSRTNEIKSREIIAGQIPSYIPLQEFKKKD